MDSLTVMAPTGRRASPYRIAGRALIKRVQERHIYRRRQAVGIDESVWKAHKDDIDVVRFEFPDGSVREIDAVAFESKSFLHGDGVDFAVTRFILLAELVLVKDGMRPLFDDKRG